ncbi:MAG: tryptophan synthase subunit alpha [Anaerolineae bacterium]|nr:tryptophan synthase subunit alpha [Anaerolineae bacterium]MDW8067505.1 tryptophan synthase subunit alpha [Anaerolineae bacterium]
MTGVDRIAGVFATTRGQGRAALMPYLTLGYPSPEMTVPLIRAVIGAGADMLELGIPFSDPLADGPTIQRATHRALQQGMTVARCLEMVAALRQEGVSVPLVLMSYYNPILAYGEAAFCRAAQEVGADGLIVPDLPPEEGAALESGCRSHGLALVYLLAPTSTPKRIRLVAERSAGFIYLVSVTGTTGAREHLPPDLEAFIQRVRAVTEKPLAVGFGIASREQARAVGALADGVIVGSALIQVVEQGGIAGASAFVADLRSALNCTGRGPRNPGMNTEGS